MADPVGPGGGGGDYLRFEATFNNLEAAQREFISRLEGEWRELKAQGDTIRAAQIEAQLAELRKGGGTETAAVNEATAALDREAAALQRNLDLSLRQLDTLRLEAEQRAALAEMNRRVQAGPEIILPPERRGVSDPRYLAGGQVAAETMLAEQQRIAALKQEALDRDAADARVLAEQNALLDAQATAYARARAEGYKAAALGGRADMPALMKPAVVGSWGKEAEGLIRYNALLGEYGGFEQNAALKTGALNAQLTRQGIAAAEASNELRRHGALTTEYLTALARGETTVGEFGYQLGATIAKFSGWVTAAAATYAAFGAVVEFGKGAEQAASGVQMLTRTIDHLDPHKANQAIQALSQETNVPIEEAAHAIFLYSRTFHNLDDASAAAKLGLSAFKLDQVSLTDSVKSSTAIVQQFGGGVGTLKTVYNELAAGQREWNARITEMIPLLQKSTGAVHNAGGDLNELIQLGVYAQRITQLGGSQIGTAFSRSAANFLNPSTTKGQADRATLEQLGINVNQGWTAIMRDAILKSPSLGSVQRSEAANAIFGPRFGGLLAAMLNPQGISAYRNTAGLAGDPRKAITPEATRGALQSELDRQLGTFKERIHSFVNEMQRFGASFADSGLMTALGDVISLITKVGGGIREVANAFDGLPGPVKEVVTLLGGLRLAMLFLTRTRFGASIPGARLVPRIGALGDQGFEEQQLRADLSRGTRQAMDVVEQDIAQSSARATAAARTAVMLDRQRATILAEGVRFEDLSLQEQEKVNDLSARIAAAQREESRINTERAAQLETLGGLKRQMVGLSASRFASDDKRYSTAQVRELGVAAGLVEADQRNMTLLQRAKLQFSTTQRANAAATAAYAEATAAGESAITASGAAMSAATAELTAEGTMLAGLGARIRTFAAALDPVLIALFGIPLAIEEIHHIQSMRKQAYKPLAPGQATSLSQLQQQAARATRSTANGPTSIGPSLGGLNPFSEDENSYDARLNAATALSGLADVIKRARERTLLSSVQQVGLSLHELSLEAQTDIRQFEKHKTTKAEFTRQMNELARSSHSSIDVLTASSAKQGNDAIAAFTGIIKGELRQAMADTAKTAKSFFEALGQLSDKQLEQQVQGYSDRADTYGLSGGDLRKAGLTYLYLAAKFRASNDSKGLQLVKQAQSAFVSAVNKNVQDLLHAGESATTYGGQLGDDTAAVSAITHMHSQVRAWVAMMDRHFRKYPAIIKAVAEAAKQIDANLNDQLKSAIDQQVQLIETKFNLQAAEVTGISPQADIERAQITLDGLKAALAKAQAEGASYSTIAGLLTQIDSSTNALIKQKIDNARSILDAQNQLAVASITAIGPAADMQRAQRTLAGAQRILAFDKAHGAGNPTLLQDQAAIDNARQALNQQLQSRNQQLDQDLANLIQAQAALQESETTDPIKQARIQLAADIKALALIKPRDYQNPQQYLAAVAQAKAKINNDRTSTQQAIVNQDLQNLAFEYNIQKIGDQQYINGLERILHMKKLTLQQRQQIEEQIFQLKHQGGNLDLNVGSVKIPSIYEIRRAIGLGKQGTFPAGANTVVNHSSNVIVNVYGQRNVAAVGQVLDNHLGTSVRAAMRARGVG